MKLRHGLTVGSFAIALLVIIVVASPQGQGRGQGGGRGPGGAPAANLPQTPTAVSLPSVSDQITGPGPIYESTPSLAPGKGLTTFKYEAKEYFISGTANGQPYKTRLVVRKPSNNSKFSGLVLVEPMHPSGSAHMFEFTSIYTMSSGHAAVEVLAGGLQLVVDSNKERYKDLQVAPAQTSEILAQVGSLIKSKDTGPFAGLPVRKIILAGTSATAGTLIQYLPAHMVYRTPTMQRIYDLFADVEWVRNPPGGCAAGSSSEHARSSSSQHHHAPRRRYARRPVQSV